MKARHGLTTDQEDAQAKEGERRREGERIYQLASVTVNSAFVRDNQCLRWQQQRRRRRYQFRELLPIKVQGRAGLRRHTPLTRRREDQPRAAAAEAAVWLCTKP